ncbi:MAG: carbohydrate-binding domain-containing protein, partial [Halanaerobium sp.]
LSLLLLAVMLIGFKVGNLTLITQVEAVEQNNYLLGNNNVKKPSEAGKLSLQEIEGQKTLVDQNGKLIQLRGMSTHGLQWFGEIVNDNAFAALADDWESNLIRLALYVGEDGYYHNPELKELVYEGIELAFKHDMYVIVDWHVHAPGDPRAEIYEGAYDFFEELAAHYQDHPKSHHLIWELANEPSPNDNGGPGITNDKEGWLAVKEYAEPIVEMLRSYGDNIIIVGSPNWSQRPDLAADNPIKADNIMYTVHFYTGTHEPAAESYDKSTPNQERTNVMSNARYALENGVGIFATEWGVSEASGDNGPYLEEADQWLKFLNKNNISWANWSLTNKNEVSGSFTPFIMNQSEAAKLDPGPDQKWDTAELSLSGEYVRTRIKGEEYNPIDRDIFSKVIWDFSEGTTEGFVVNQDSPIKDVEIENEENSLKISGLGSSNDLSADNFWANLRISADEWGQSVDILGAEEITIDIISTEPAPISIAAVPQGPAAGWANPERAVQINESDFVESEDKYKAVLTLTAEDSPSLATIANSSEDNTLENIVLFIGADVVDEIYLDKIAVSGKEKEIEVEHAPIGEAVFPSDFNDETRQGWEWDAESAVNETLSIEKIDGNPTLSWEFAYPEVKPDDNWATAPRLTLFKDNLKIEDNENLVFDLFINPERGSEGSMNINLIFQPPDFGYWAQAEDIYKINFEELNGEDDLHYHEVKISLDSFENIKSETELRNMILIFAEGEPSDFAGRVYIDNIRFE